MGNIISVTLLIYSYLSMKIYLHKKKTQTKVEALSKHISNTLQKTGV